MHIGLTFSTVFVPRIWFQVSGKVDAIVYPCMKLHGIQCHFREVPHAVAEYRLRRRPRPSRIVLVVVLVHVLDAVSSNFFTNLLFSTTSTRTSTKRIRLNRMHTPCALNLIPCRLYETSVSFSIRPAVFLAGGRAEH
jgi:hypothetical protein